MTVETLSLRGVGMSFGSIVALNSIDIELPSTGIVAFVGPNGSGKSTLFDILSGFIRQSSGKIASKTLKRTLGPRDLIARVARLHQRLVVPPNLSADAFLAVVAGQLSLSSLVSPASWTAIRAHLRDNISSEILRAAHLIESMDKPLSKLSYGQQRILALEAVFAAKKPFIALDEPLAGLHPSVRDTVLSRIQNEGRTRCVLIAEHDLAGALAVAERLFVLKLGNIVADLPSTGLTTADLVARF